MLRIFLSLILFFSVLSVSADEDPMLVNVKRISMETALKIAKAAVDACRKEAIQVGVTVVDRTGQTQVVLRDVLAPELTLTVSQQKAYTAVSFNLATSVMEDRFKSPFSVGKVEGLVFGGGGLPIQAGGRILGAVGVSGAPSGKTDEKCAKAGIAAVIDDLEMAE
ncbi:MAG: heme-binding protein [Gammaproteobacteria bacterium]|nr:heme-binding protein [Gammaproteobacteria bacterium]